MKAVIYARVSKIDREDRVPPETTSIASPVHPDWPPVPLVPTL